MATAPDNFYNSYIACMMWASSLDAEQPGLSTDDLAPELIAQARADCDAFYAANAEAINCDDAPNANDGTGCDGMAGHDFWLTRCGHGAGFWDGHWPEPYATQLDNASKAFGNVDLYVGDDGKVYGC